MQSGHRDVVYSLYALAHARFDGTTHVLPRVCVGRYTWINEIDISNNIRLVAVCDTDFSNFFFVVSLFRYGFELRQNDEIREHVKGQAEKTRKIERNEH